MATITAEQAQPHRRRSSVARLAASIRRTTSGSIPLSSSKPQRPDFEYGRSNSVSVMETYGTVAYRAAYGRGKRPDRGVMLRSGTLEDANETDEPDTSGCRSKLGLLFFALLPTELQIQIISFVSYKDLFSIRQTSHAFHHLLHTNEHVIIRNLLTYHDLLPGHSDLILTLYPPPTTNSALNLSYISSLAHRHAACFHLAETLSVNVSNDVFGASNGPKYWKNLRPKCKNMVPKMIPGLLTLFHFFETYRSANLSGPISHSVTELRILQTYSNSTLLEAHKIYQILYRALTRSLRPPSYAGTVERSLRGWRRPPPPPEDIVKLLIFGGLQAVNRVMRHPSYNIRIDTLRAALMSLSNPAISGIIPKTTSIETIVAFQTNTVMPSPASEVSTIALRLLPRVQDIWQHTAERLLLENEVVTRLADITDTYQFMGELMQSDDEDECNGPAAPQSSANRDNELREGAAESGEAGVDGGENSEPGTGPPARQPLVSSHFGNYAYFG